jgi:hypothetical protein
LANSILSNPPGNPHPSTFNYRWDTPALGDAKGTARPITDTWGREERIVKRRDLLVGAISSVIAGSGWLRAYAADGGGAQIAGGVSATLGEAIAQSSSAVNVVAPENGVADNSQALQEALSSAGAGAAVILPRGVYKITRPVGLPGNVTLRGAGRNATKLLLDFVEGPSMLMNGNGIAVEDMEISTSKPGQGYGIGTAGQATYASFQNVWFSKLARAVNVAHPLYWSRFIGCDFRECKEGVVSERPQAVNAVSFVACSFFRTEPSGTDYPIKLHGAHGVSILGCSVQNIGPYLHDSDDVLISGGYYEAYKANAITAINSRVDLHSIHAPAGTRFDFDNASYAKSSGMLPASSPHYPLAPVAHDYSNIFPDPGCSTSRAAEGWTSVPTGISLAPSVGSNGHLQLFRGDNNALARAAWRLPSGIAGAAVYVKWRCLRGSARVQFYDGSTKFGQYTIAEDPYTWVITRLHTRLKVGTPTYLVFLPAGFSDSQVRMEIDELLIVPKFVCIGEVRIGEVLNLLEK